MLGAAGVQAAVVTCSDRTAFDAGVAGVTAASVLTEYYETAIAVCPATGARSIGLPSFDVTCNGDRQFGVDTTTAFKGNQALGVVFPVESTTGSPDRLTFTFSSAMVAFRTDVCGVQGPNYQYRLCDNVTQVAQGAAMPDSDIASAQLFGVTSDQAFTAIAFSQGRQAAA